ncbi:MAG: LuxR C-terminal-related transcriptional regulator [Tannerella sp.]|nr:LuxR C-terminal-related transcriptional regulator [Tannerella sp.]
MPDTLQSIGLRSLLIDYFPPVEIMSFASFDASSPAGKDFFDYYFTLPELFVIHAGFFLPKRNKTICLLYGSEDSPDIHSYHYLRIHAPHESIIEQLRQILQDENTANPQIEMSKELSARETDVLQLIVTGITNKEIADKLYISLNTVLTHRKNITAKLGIKTIPGLTFYAITHGLISGKEIEL